MRGEVYSQETAQISDPDSSSSSVGKLSSSEDILAGGFFVLLFCKKPF